MKITKKKELLPTSITINELYHPTFKPSTTSLTFLKVVLDSFNLLSRFPYSLEWNDQTKSWSTTGSLRGRVCFTFLMMLTLAHHLITRWSAISSVSSKREHLTNNFEALREVNSLLAYFIYFYSGTVKLPQFERVLGLLNSTDMNSYVVEKNRLRRYTLLLSLAIVVLLLPEKLGLLHAPWETILASFYSSLEQPFGLTPEFLVRNFGVSETIGISLQYLFTQQFVLIFWCLTIFNLAFAAFFRAHVVQFKGFIEHTSRHRKDAKLNLFNEYRFLTEGLRELNTYMGPSMFSSVCSVIGFFPYFFSGFSTFDVHLTAIFVPWSILVPFTLILAADCCVQGGEIKRILIHDRERLEPYFSSCTEYLAMLSELSNDKVWGISCMGTYTIDYGLVASILTTVATFSIILIQAK